jgi:hypothetical protein
MTPDQKIDLLLEKATTLETLVAAILPYRRLPEELKRKVDRLGGGVTTAYRGARAQEALEMFVKCVTMPGSKKRKANFPRETLDQWDMKTGTVTVRRIVPLSHLVARLAALKSFRPAGAEELSSRDNAEKAIAESGLVVSNLAELRLKRHSTVPVVLEPEFFAQLTGKAAEKGVVVPEIEEEELEEDEPSEHLKAEMAKPCEGEEVPARKPYVPPVSAKSRLRGFGDDAPEVVAEIPGHPDNPVFASAPVVERRSSKKKLRGFRVETTTDVVDTRDVVDEEDLTDTTDVVVDPTLPEDDDTDGWGEDEQPEGDPFADFRLSGQQQAATKESPKGGRVVDLFAE